MPRPVLAPQYWGIEVQRQFWDEDVRPIYWQFAERICRNSGLLLQIFYQYSLNEF
jgi:hypothetical protein